jgi:hypothetical protein
MSARRNKATSRGHVIHRISAIAAVPVAIAAAALATVEASASPWAPDSAYQHAQVQTDGWPDEGTGYPGYGDPSPMGTVPDDWPDEGKGYPGYADESSPTGAGSHQGNGLDTSSVALGAMGGIALGGAALGITLVVQRRRDHITLPTA